MLKLTEGNILQADVEALVNAVNCVGVMGRGIALQFRLAYPDNFKAYQMACEHKQLIPGRMFVYATGRQPHFIINFPTKRHWRHQSRIEDIESGLVALVKEIQARNIHSVAIPALGCGLGGLMWNDVRPKIERAFVRLSGVQAVIYEPI